MPSTLTSVVVLSLAFIPAALACPDRNSPQSTGNITARAMQITRRDVQAGGKCGTHGDGAACAPGLCCSEEGACGTSSHDCTSPGCQINFGPACDGNKSPDGPSTADVPRIRFGDVEYGVELLHCKIPGKIALTFDDGPKEYTSELLDTLKANNVKATFFITGTNNGKGQIENRTTSWPSLIKRMHKEEHQIASHSWSHEHFVRIDADKRRDQILRLETALVAILDFFPTYMRPPYTEVNDEIKAEYKRWGYHMINYDLDTKDDIQPEDLQVARNAFSSAISKTNPKEKSFLAIAHDIQPNTVGSLAQYMIDESRRNGYELVTVGECLGDPKNNWYRDAKTGLQFGGPPPPPAQAVVPSAASGAASQPPSSRPASSGPAALATTAPTSSAKGPAGAQGSGGTPKSSGTSGSAAPTPTNSASRGVIGVLVSMAVAEVLFICL